jgi:prepilin-type processing-associated H-X9-DG protein
MANVYAGDNTRGDLPSFPVKGAGGNPPDVSSNFLSKLEPYGMTVPMYFCPVRSSDWQVANHQFKYGMPPLLPAQHRFMRDYSIVDLNKWVNLGRSFGGYAKLIHNWWVPRVTDLTPVSSALAVGGGSLYPWPVPGFVPNGALPWPQRITDDSASLQPIISDYAEAFPATHDISLVPPAAAGQLGWGHFYGGSLKSINVGFADGHVVSHNRSSIQWRYDGNGGQESYFY